MVLQFFFFFYTSTFNSGKHIDYLRFLKLQNKIYMSKSAYGVCNEEFLAN